ncbi:MAG: hypothetical protein ACYCYE_14425 [Clostridia bacterium]
MTKCKKSVISIFVFSPYSQLVKNSIIINVKAELAVGKLSSGGIKVNC